MNFRKLYANQKFSEIHSLVKREIYLSQLRQLRDVQLIKAIAGVRRSGKSTLLQQLGDELLAAGVLPQNIQHYNLEAPENTDFEHWKDFYYHIKENLQDEGMSYILLDEIQMLNGFERLLDGLHILKNADLYVTGSNAYLLSSELATILTGRSAPLPWATKNRSRATPFVRFFSTTFLRLPETGGFSLSQPQKRKIQPEP